tara:strand:+ start:3867 stop:4808 length:942 start_codon:yes stop_codon:yes gene_type:complete
MKDLGMLNETEFIKKYIKKGSKKNKYSLNFEDDVAVLNNCAYSTDTISEEIHFFSDDDPKTIAKKLIRVNVSDLISKGVKPQFCLLNFSSGRIVNKSWLDSFFKSFHQDLNKYNLTLIGGDTVTTRMKTVLSLTIFGKVRSNKIIKRSSARVSDYIYVSGTIGDSFIGMNIKKKQIDFDEKAKDKLISRYLIPEPQIHLTNLIKNKANSSTDISDGLLNDLQNICDMSNLGAEISFSLIPKSKEVIKFLASYKRYEKLILTGGDDYQILFTGPKGLNRYKNVTEIGRMTRNKGIKIIDKNFNNLLSGYNHSIY